MLGPPLEQFAMDCGLMTADFTTMRINNLFIRADQVDDKKTAKTVKVMTRTTSCLRLCASGGREEAALPEQRGTRPGVCAR